MKKLIIISLAFIAMSCGMNYNQIKNEGTTGVKVVQVDSTEYQSVMLRIDTRTNGDILTIIHKNGTIKTVWLTSPTQTFVLGLVTILLIAVVIVGVAVFSENIR